MDEIHLLLVDDQVLFIESLKRVLESLAPDIKVDTTAYNGATAIELLDEYTPHIVLMDVKMPVMDGVEATKIMHQKYPDIHIIMLTTFDDDDYVFEALRNGAVGYILKDISPQELITSIRAVHNGSVLISPSVAKTLIRDKPSKAKIESETNDEPIWFQSLSSREKEILKCMVEGLKNREISEKLFIAEQTVRNHVSTIYAKIGENNRYHLIEESKKFLFG
jgi:DNA-binding NarL/FixJ family response regulator